MTLCDQQQYATKAYAEKKAQETAKQYGYPLRVYACGMCGCYHVVKK